jgi:hypothetical protein
MSAGLPDRRLCVIVAKTWWGVDLRRRHGDAAVVRACRASLRRRDAAAASMCVSSSSACPRGARRAPAAAYGGHRLSSDFSRKAAPRQAPGLTVARRELRSVRSSRQSSVCKDAAKSTSYKLVDRDARKNKPSVHRRTRKFTKAPESSFRSRGALPPSGGGGGPGGGAAKIAKARGCDQIDHKRAAAARKTRAPGRMTPILILRSAAAA